MKRNIIYGLLLGLAFVLAVWFIDRAKPKSYYYQAVYCQEEDCIEVGDVTVEKSCPNTAKVFQEKTRVGNKDVIHNLIYGIKEGTCKVYELR